ncbi:hypothetical protein [Streptomyces sp. NPDC058374]|uniref:hypothetical protein n=1 Tax=Streptomyces sp. NPDC058374 TaxID=3346466 RepID=UPI0036688145
MNRIDAGADGPEQGRPPSAHVHDPFEVTIQMDGIGRALEGARAPRGAHAKPPQEPADGPVFVDESGRRGRHLRRIGLACGIAFAGYAVVVVATLFSGNSSAPWLPLPGPEADRPVGTVDGPALPEESADATGEPVDPGEDATPAAGTSEAPAAPAGSSTGGSDRPAGTASGEPVTPADPAPEETGAPPAPKPKPSNTGGPGTPADPPGEPDEPPAESDDTPTAPETPPGDGGGTLPQAAGPASAPQTVHALARTAPPEENQAA